MAAKVFSECSRRFKTHHFCIKGLFLTNKDSVSVRVDGVIYFSFTDNEQADIESLLRLQKVQTVCSFLRCPFSPELHNKSRLHR